MHQARAIPHDGRFLRIRITHRLTGSIDGIQLSRYEVGHVYEVATLVGCYLLASGYAEPVDDMVAEVVPLHAQGIDNLGKRDPASPLTFDLGLLGRPDPAGLAEAADRRRRPRGKRAKTR